MNICDFSCNFSGSNNLVCCLWLSLNIFILMVLHFFCSSEFVLVSTGTAEYTLNKEDVGRRLEFVYMPINFEGRKNDFILLLTYL